MIQPHTTIPVQTIGASNDRIQRVEQMLRQLRVAEGIDSCHGRCIGINKIYILNPTTVVKLLQYSGSRVEQRDGFSSYK